MKLYQIDFLLKQKLDQFAALFNAEEPKEKNKNQKAPNGAALIVDPEGRELWIKSFGESVRISFWKK